MRALCAWCDRKGGRPVLGGPDGGEGAPPTHGICDHHEQEILASLPSRSFPCVVLLIVVDQHEVELYRELHRLAGRTAGVAIIVERRTAERRQSGGAANGGRRHGDRRRRRPIVTGSGYVAVRLGG